MRAILLALVLGLAPLAALAQSGEPVREIETDKSVQEAVDALVDVLESGGMTVFARIDHGAAASEAGAEIGAMQLVMFGDPEIASSVIQASRTAGLALPMKVLVYEGAGGQVRMAWEDPAARLAGFGGIEEESEYVQRMRLAIDNYVSRAAAPGF